MRYLSTSVLRVMTTVGIIKGDAGSGSVCIINRCQCWSEQSLAEDVWRARQQQSTMMCSTGTG